MDRLPERGKGAHDGPDVFGSVPGDRAHMIDVQPTVNTQRSKMPTNIDVDPWTAVLPVHLRPIKKTSQRRFVSIPPPPQR